MRGKLFTVIAMTLIMCLVLSGCMALEFGVNFNQDGSGTCDMNFYLADEVFAEMGGNPEDIEATTGGDVVETKVVHKEFDGVPYSGQYAKVNFSSPAELQSFLSENGANSMAEQEVTGFTVTESVENGQKLVTIAIKMASEAAVTDEAGPTVEGAEELGEALVAMMRMEISITFPGGVKSVTGDKSLYTISNKTVKINMLSQATEMTMTVVGILGEDAGNTSQTPAPGSDPRDAKFPVVRTYANNFKDVSADTWYAESLSRAYGIGIVSGTTADTYSPDGTLTLAQVTTMAARMRSIYDQDGETFSVKDGEAWYQPYVRYAINKGILETGKFSNYDVAASRAMMAYMFARALPDEMYTNGNLKPDFGDVSRTGNPYYSYIMKLYNAGIVAGTGNGNYSPDANVTRAQAAVFAARLATPSSRV